MAIVPRPVPVKPGTPPPASTPAPPGATGSRLVRALKIVVAALGAVVIVAALTFPTETIVRRVVASVTPAAGPFLVFEHAALRPWGLRLDAPRLRDADGKNIATAEWVRVRPSFLGLLRDGTGRPWRIASAICGGTLAADVTVAQTAAAIDATWTDLDVGACLPPLPAGLTIAGRVTGHATARAGDGTPPAGQGEVHLRDALWQQENSPFPGLDTLHADTAELRWTVAEERLVVEGLELHGPELELTGGGTIRLSGSTARNGLDLALTIVPGPEASDELVRALDQLPRAAAGQDPMARALVVKGTLGQPIVTMR